jgi:hypothetical protein
LTFIVVCFNLRFNLSNEYAKTLDAINGDMNLGAEETAATEELDAIMTGSIREAAKAVTPTPKKRRERLTVLG